MAQMQAAMEVLARQSRRQIPIPTWQPLQFVLPQVPPPHAHSDIQIDNGGSNSTATATGHREEGVETDSSTPEQVEERVEEPVKGVVFSPLFYILDDYNGISILLYI